MQDTVRDAVFGNVGTMISFRVSADDSPILAKQFEPQFEPNDLLQMHNRNFIINMVINGEKAPAFSAKTLNLPTYQDDNTGRIIQWTREHYSRQRSEIEAEINERMLPPENLTVKRPGPAYTPPKTPEQRAADRIARQQAQQSQNQPQPAREVSVSKKTLSPTIESGILQIDHGRTKPSTKAATSTASTTPVKPTSGKSEADNSDTAATKPKRKRTRSRRKKPAVAKSNE